MVVGRWRGCRAPLSPSRLPRFPAQPVVLDRVKLPASFLRAGILPCSLSLSASNQSPSGCSRQRHAAPAFASPLPPLKLSTVHEVGRRLGSASCSSTVLSRRLNDELQRTRPTACLVPAQMAASHKVLSPPNAAAAGYFRVLHLFPTGRHPAQPHRLGRWVEPRGSWCRECGLDLAMGTGRR